MPSFLIGFLMDLFTALMLAVLVVFMIGIFVALDWVYCTLLGWIFRIPKD